MRSVCLESTLYVADACKAGRGESRKIQPHVHGCVACDKCATPDSQFHLDRGCATDQNSARRSAALLWGIGPFQMKFGRLAHILNGNSGISSLLSS